MENLEFEERNSPLGLAPPPQIVYPIERDIYLQSVQARHRATFLVLGILGLTIFAFQQVLLHLAYGWILFPMLVLAVWMTHRAIEGWVRRSHLRLAVRSNSFKVFSSDGDLRQEVDLTRVSACRFWKPGDRGWLTFTLDNGESVEIGEGATSVLPADRARRQLFREMAPYVDKRALPLRSDPSDDPIVRRFQESGYSLPTVRMEPGKVYRYADRDHLRKYLQSRRTGTRIFNWNHSVLIVAQVLLVPMTIKFGNLALIYFFSVLVLIASVAMQAWLGLPSRFVRSIKDRFELVPEGLKVTRGGRSWVVRDPEPASQGTRRLYLADAPVLRYGKGARAYYFDPRFLEEDSP